jgi:hypothetical protein
MSEKKKTTKKDKKLRVSPKVLRILNIIFAVIAVVSLVATVLLSPIGDKIFKKEETKPTPDAPTTTEAPVDTTSETEIRFGLYYSPSLDKYYWPESTDPVVDTSTNYKIVVNTVSCNYVRDAGVTTIMAKEDISATMVITPMPSVPYETLKENTAKSGTLVGGKTLPEVEISCCYSSEADGYKTVVYCVDDLAEGSIEIRYSYPTTYENSYEERFEMMLTMFELAY